MKKGIIIAAAVVVAAGIGFYAWLGTCGHTLLAKIKTERSDNFTSEETDAAAMAVLDYFETNFKGCNLKELRYENGKTQGYAEPEYITFYSDFTAFPFICDPTLGGKQTNFDFILSKNDSGVWEVRTYGYA